MHIKRSLAREQKVLISMEQHSIWGAPGVISVTDNAGTATSAHEKLTRLEPFWKWGQRGHRRETALPAPSEACQKLWTGQDDNCS